MHLNDGYEISAVSVNVILINGLLGEDQTWRVLFEIFRIPRISQLEILCFYPLNVLLTLIWYLIEAYVQFVCNFKRNISTYLHSSKFSNVNFYSTSKFQL